MHALGSKHIRYCFEICPLFALADFYSILQSVLKNCQGFLTWNIGQIFYRYRTYVFRNGKKMNTCS